jgi:uncharacterized membrane protein (UPF0182 family)
VEPSELALETPYLKWYIDSTRQAYDLATVQETSYPAMEDLTPAVLARNKDTIENIRLWDERPLLAMYQQTQAIRLYQRAFPGVFKNLDELSPDLKEHLRYPEDLFAVQSDEYKTFHMTDPQVFYNREDQWVAPNETYAGQKGPMQPYYILMKLPGSDTLKYLLMTPFTPQNRNNMISWMAARCDFPDYGRKLFYELPKEKLIYGPNQIEAMIDQDPTISQQLTLWDQKGSHVIRGKLIVTPIENAFVYVVPIYLQAEGENFPQLKRVIAVTGDHVVMKPTLDEPMANLFAKQPPLAVFGNTKG